MMTYHGTEPRLYRITEDGWTGKGIPCRHPVFKVTTFKAEVYRLSVLAKWSNSICKVRLLTGSSTLRLGSIPFSHICLAGVVEKQVGAFFV